MKRGVNEMVMKRITLNELRQLAQAANGKINKIYLHWTAGNYHQFFGDYHLNIDNDGAIMVTTDDLTEYKAHTWCRNSRAIGIALACCADAVAYADGRVDFGTVPPTAMQIDSMAKVVAVLCEELGLDINVDTVMTHAEAADLDDYGPARTFERWDLWKLPDLPGDGVLKPGGDIIRGKAIWWQQNW